MPNTLHIFLFGVTGKWICKHSKALKKGDYIAEPKRLALGSRDTVGHGTCMKKRLLKFGRVMSNVSLYPGPSIVSFKCLLKSKSGP